MIALARSATDLPFRFTMPEFGNQVHHVRARRGNNIAGRKAKHDPAAALTALLIGGRETDKRLAPLGRVCAAHKLQLASGAAHVAVAVGFRSHLSLQIHLRGVVDRHYFLVLHDDVRRVRVVHLVAVHVRVAVDRRVKGVRPQGKRICHLAWIDVFRDPVTRPER